MQKGAQQNISLSLSWCAHNSLLRQFMWQRRRRRGDGVGGWIPCIHTQTWNHHHTGLTIHKYKIIICMRNAAPHTNTTTLRHRHRRRETATIRSQVIHSGARASTRLHVSACVCSYVPYACMLVASSPRALNGSMHSWHRTQRLACDGCALTWWSARCACIHLLFVIVL